MSQPTAGFSGIDRLLGVGPGPTFQALRSTLRDAMNGPGIVLPGVTDALGLRLVEEAGFPAAYLTGAGLANAGFGLPDVGLVSSSDVVDHVARLANVSRLPLVVDADTGFGGPVTAMQTARLLERAGATAIQIEDQEMPKRCGHFEEHELISTEHMATKIVAVRQGLQDPKTVIIARTDARGVLGIDEAIQRAARYRQAGADVLFVEALRSVAELERVGAELRGTPLLVNVVEGGKTPELTVAEYHRLGYSLVLYANYLMRSFMHAGREALAHLARAGETTSRSQQMVGWSQRQELFHLDSFLAAQAHFDRVGSSEGPDHGK